MKEVVNRLTDAVDKDAPISSQPIPLDRTTLYITITGLVGLGCLVFLAAVAPTHIATQAPLIASLVTGIVLVLQKMKDTDAKVTHTASQVAESTDKVATVLADTTATTATKLDGMAVVLDKVHVLSNSQSLAQDKLLAETLQWKAEREPNSDNIAAAQAAEKKYRDHAARQEKVDAGDAKT